MKFGKTLPVLTLAIAIQAVFALSSRADVIIENQPSDGYVGLPISPINIHVGEEAGAFGWSQTATYTDVSVNANIAINGGPIEYWLTGSVNQSPQTVLFHGTASPSGTIDTSNFIFSIPELGPGTYYFIARGVPDTADGWAASDPDCPGSCAGPPFSFSPVQTAPGVSSLGSYTANVYSTSLPQGTFANANFPWDFEVDGVLLAAAAPEPSALPLIAGLAALATVLAKRCIA